MQNYYLNYSHDAFGCMSDILGEHFYFKFGKKYKEVSFTLRCFSMSQSLDYFCNKGTNI